MNLQERRGQERDRQQREVPVHSGRGGEGQRTVSGNPRGRWGDGVTVEGVRRARESGTAQGQGATRDWRGAGRGTGWQNAEVPSGTRHPAPTQTHPA